MQRLTDVPASSRKGALSWGVRACVVMALMGLAGHGLERLVLAYPARLGVTIEGFPAGTIDSLARVGGDVAYFGDSVVQTIASPDTEHRLLPDLLARDVGLRVARVSQAATGAEVHAAWLANLSSRPIRPRAVVIAVNPRSFSPHWERNPGWVFTDLAARVRHPLLARLASVLEWDWGRPSAEEFAATPVIVGGVAVGTIAEFDQGTGGDPARLTHDRYLVRYASDFSRSRRIEAFRALIDEANAMSFPVVFYLTPVDVEAARAELTAQEMAHVEENLALLGRELARSNWPVVDASQIVAHVDFDHLPNDPHEHLRGPARIEVSRLVAAALTASLEGDRASGAAAP